MTFYAKVVSSQINEVPRISGDKLIVAEGQLGDETGVINFRVVGDFAGKLGKDRIVAVRNARSEVFQEHMRIELDRWGKISEEKVKKPHIVSNFEILNATWRKVNCFLIFGLACVLFNFLRVSGHNYKC